MTFVEENGQLRFHFQLRLPWLQSNQMGSEFRKSIQELDFIQEFKTFYGNGNLLLLPKIQRIYCIPSEE